MLDHFGSQGIREIQVHDGLCFAQHRADLAAVVAAEVGPHALAQVRRLADVQHVIALAPEHVDPGSPREVGGHLELRGLRVTCELGQRDEIVEAEDTEARRPLDQQVEQVGGRERVVEGTMARSVVEAEAGRECSQTAIRHLVTNQPPCERDGVDDGAVGGCADRRPIVALTGGSQEADVEADVVADDDRVADELDQ